MNENIFQEKVIENLKGQFINIYLLNTSMRYAIGVPDLILGVEGKMVCIELKVCRKEHATIQYLFPKGRKQIATMFDIEKGLNKAYGMILFSVQKKVMLFRIDFNLWPITDYDKFKFINNLDLRCIVMDPKIYYKNIFKEIYIDDIQNLTQILNHIVI